MRRGRALRFVVVVVAAWGSGRLVVFLAEEERLRSPRAVVAQAAAARPVRPIMPFVAYSIARAAVAGPVRDEAGAVQRRSLARGAASYQPREAAARPDDTAAARPELVGALPPPPAPPPNPSVEPRPATLDAERWRLDGWAIVRGRGGATPLTPQLGGSQVGARLSYALDTRGRWAGFARAAAPLHGSGAEVAAGVQVRPVAALPITAYAELRQRDRGGPSATVGVFGGVYDQPVAGGARLDGYAQGGWAGGPGATAFIDGQAVLRRAVAAAGAATLSLTAGAWGAAQRDAARLDAGPGITASLPVADGRVRAQLDWRWRLAGNARPASGPALTLAAGF